MKQESLRLSDSTSPKQREPRADTSSASTVGEMRWHTAKTSCVCFSRECNLFCRLRMSCRTTWKSTDRTNRSQTQWMGTDKTIRGTRCDEPLVEGIERNRVDLGAMAFTSHKWTCPLTLLRSPPDGRVWSPLVGEVRVSHRHNSRSSPTDAKRFGCLRCHATS